MLNSKLRTHWVAILMIMLVLSTSDKGVAAPMPDFKIATIDTARVLDEYKVSKAALDELLNRREVLKRALEKRGSEAKALLVEMRAQTGEKANEIARHLKELRREAAEFEQLEREKIATDYRATRKVFLNRIGLVAKTVARERSCVMTVDRSATSANGTPTIIDVVNEVDITDQVIVGLNETASDAASATATTAVTKLEE